MDKNKVIKFQSNSINNTVFSNININKDLSSFLIDKKARIKFMKMFGERYGFIKTDFCDIKQGSRIAFVDFEVVTTESGDFFEDFKIKTRY